MSKKLSKFAVFPKFTFRLQYCMYNSLEMRSASIGNGLRAISADTRGELAIGG
jgi:hypothetical protein